MLSLAKGGYTAEQVKKQLHYGGGSRDVSFRYEILNKNDVYIGDLDQVEASISFDSEAAIKRTGNFIINRNTLDEIDWNNESIRPFYRLRMGVDVLEWPLGILLLSSPSRSAGNSGKVTRSIEAFDKSQILKEDKFTTRYLINSGSSYTAAITDILYSAGISKVSLEESLAELTTAIEFEIGTDKLSAVNDLLSAINYYSLWFDDQGFATSKAYQEPYTRNVEYEYRTDAISIIKPGAKETIDLFDAPNVFVRVLSSPETTVLKSVYTNDSPGSPLSTVNRGRNIVDYDTVSDIADQSTLDAYVRRIAINANQLYKSTTFKTATMPHHTFVDCLYVEHSDLGAGDVYIEKAWSMDLRAGGNMTHEVRKVIRL